MKSPDRAEHVGSLLRPAELLQARTAFAEGRLNPEQLGEIEDRTILGALEKQYAAGLDRVTDGEFRRGSWLTDMADAVQGFVRSVASTGRWREEMARLKQEIAMQRNPLAKLGLLERFARKVGNESREARDAFARVQREASATGARRDPQELLRIFHDLTGTS